VVNLALNLALIPNYGLIGAAWSTAATYAFAAASYWTLGRRAMKLPIPLDTLVKAGLATGMMALAVLAVPTVGGLVELLLKAGVGAAAYAVAALVLDVANVRAPASRVLKAVQAKWAT
jgi:O-antigen/teichoic acid export membrane protein